MPASGIHQNVCPYCQCGQLYPGREAMADNRSVLDEVDDITEADSEMGSSEE